VLEAVVECPGVSRQELAARLGRSPDSLKDLLKKLRNLGLVEQSAGEILAGGRLGAHPR
jgi:DNA-binding IclR family transcriptional regulator